MLKQELGPGELVPVDDDKDVVFEQDEGAAASPAGTRSPTLTRARLDRLSSREIIHEFANTVSAVGGLVTVAVANKLARIAWAVLSRAEVYRHNVAAA